MFVSVFQAQTRITDKFSPSEHTRSTARAHTALDHWSGCLLISLGRHSPHGMTAASVDPITLPGTAMQQQLPPFSTLVQPALMQMPCSQSSGRSKNKVHRMGPFLGSKSRGPTVWPRPFGTGLQPAGRSAKVTPETGSLHPSQQNHQATTTELQTKATLVTGSPQNAVFLSLIHI